MASATSSRACSASSTRPRSRWRWRWTPPRRRCCATWAERTHTEGQIMNDLIPTDYKPRSFWERKEGVTGQIVGVALVCGAGALLYRALPTIITLLENTV